MILKVDLGECVHLADNILFIFLILADNLR